MTEDTMTDDSPSPADAPTPPEGDRSIPYARFSQVVTERNSLKSQLADLTRQVGDLTSSGATVEGLTAQLREAQADAATARSRFDTYRTIAGAGITDPDLVEAVEWQYGRLPTEDRPPLADLLSTWAESPAEAPSILRGLFSPTTPSTPASTVAPRPPSSPVGGAAESGASDVSAEALAAARQSGDLARLGDLLRRSGYGKHSFSITK